MKIPSPTPVIWWLLSLYTVVLPAQLIRVDNTTLQLPPDLPSATGYSLTNALGTLTFTTPIDLAHPPGESNRLFVVERNGRIQLVTNLAGTPVKSLFLDLNDYLTASGEGTLPQDGENGLLGLAFHPQYQDNGYFFVFYSLRRNDGGSTRTFQRVARFQVTANPGVADPGSHLALITQLDQASNHNGGDLDFGPDGYLYISTGDEGNQNDSLDNSRHINKDFFGAILRIDVDQRAGSLPPNPHAQNSVSFPSAVHAGTYTIPADNPFIGVTSHNGAIIAPSSIRTEIWATGFRNPWRMAFDLPTGRLFVGEVGQNSKEEIDLVVAGGNYGWSYLEGTINGPNIGSKPTGVTFQPPIYEYNHGNGNYQGNSVTGGIFYRGDNFPELFEKYIFADYTSGRIWSLDEAQPTWSALLLATDNNIVAIGENPLHGDPLFLDIADGRVKTLVRTGTSGPQPPPLLSQTGAFSQLAGVIPHEGIVPYEPNVSFWSDYARKQRWISLPAGKNIQIGSDGQWTFPTGTVWIKHFTLEAERGDPASAFPLETRFLVKTDEEVYGLSYRWRVDGSDADLVTESGQDVDYQILEHGNPITQTWRFPSRNECRTCHTPVAGFALSFHANQLNRNYLYGAETTNQLSAMSQAGYFQGTLPSPVEIPSLARADDETQSLEWRVRSYLEVNCVSCHQPGGAAIGNWDARSSTPTDAAGLLNGVLVTPGNHPENRLLVPGNPSRSMLLQRLLGQEAQRMPPLASHQIDSEAVALLSDWIAELPQRQSLEEWLLTHLGEDADADQDNDGDGLSNRQEFLLETNPTLPESVFQPSYAFADGIFELHFRHPANRAMVWEASGDLRDWRPWEVENNRYYFPLEAEETTLRGTIDSGTLFLRAQIVAP